RKPLSAKSSPPPPTARTRRSVPTFVRRIRTTICSPANRGFAWKPKPFAIPPWSPAPFSLPPSAGPASSPPRRPAPSPPHMALTQVRKPWPTEYGPARFRRGMYTYAYRASLHPALGLFDAPDGATSCTRRVRSNSPLQALTLLNDTAQVEFSIAFADRVQHQ